MRCFKHNKQEAKPLACPLCRTKWGDDAIEILEENRKKYRAAKQQAAKEEKKAILQAQIVDKHK